MSVDPHPSSPHPDPFIWLTRLVETAIALGLLLGLGRKWTYILGIVFSLLIWSTAEGFGGPSIVGAANLGPALAYVPVFVTLLVFDYLEGETPYSLASSQPVAQARDASLPPLLGTGNAVDLNIVATDQPVEIASGVTYKAWTFGGTVPRPTFHVRQGKTDNVTFTNKGMGQHSVDFHAAQIAPDVAYR